MNVKWGSFNFNADANKVYEEISGIGESCTPTQIVEYAREHKDSELYKCFDWDDTVAAEKWRLQQARTVVCNIVYEEVSKDNQVQNIRVIQHVPELEAYKPVSLIIRNKTEYESLLERACAELRAFKERYKMLTELEQIMERIDAIA